MMTLKFVFNNFLTNMKSYGIFNLIIFVKYITKEKITLVENSQYVTKFIIC